MPSEVNVPIQWDRTIWQGTDHTWQSRRVDAADGTPIVPSSAHAQVRLAYGQALWLDLDSDSVSGPRIDIDPVDGWVTVVIPKEATQTPEWDARDRGAWDLEVVVDGNTYRWAMGKVTVSHDVTREVV